MSRVTFDPFDPDLARQFAAAWRRHRGVAEEVQADLRGPYPESSIRVVGDDWAVYRDGSGTQPHLERAEPRRQPLPNAPDDVLHEGEGIYR